MKTIIPSILFLLCSLLLTAQNVTIELYKSGFSSPVDLQNAGDDRFFVVEQSGRIKILNADLTVNSAPYLDISSLTNGSGEQGLLGLAFHPNYSTNGYFFVNYTKNNGDSRISRFSVDPTDPNIALSGSELTIIEIVQPFGNHNGGDLAFGPDGFLYIGTGDGGAGGDPGNRAQNKTLLLGKMLRLDIDNPSGGNNYGIPLDNPFAGSSTEAQEIWAYGLRNPWRFSFDSANNDLWIADVGQGEFEEINRVANTEAGLNYGWRCYEGTQPYNTASCDPMNTMTFPLAEYDHPTGYSISGGYVYRGNTYLDLQGLYFFADYVTEFIGTVDSSGNLVNHGDFNGSWTTFGVDNNEELYIVDHDGSIYRIKGDPLGVEEFNNTQRVILVPNPASERITVSIENDQIQTASIIDIRGSVVHTEAAISSSEKSIDVSSLSQGIYLIKIVSASGKAFVKKLVVE